MPKANLLRVAIENRNWNLAAYLLVLSAVMVRVKENNGKKGSPEG